MKKWIAALMLLIGLLGGSARAEQLIVVRQTQGVNATLTRYETHSGTWQVVGKPVRAILGRGGVISAEEKQEGDGCTPSGTFSLGTAFGREKSVKGVTYSYRQATAQDVWVDDPESKNYNQWVRIAKGEQADWKSAEKLAVRAYRYALAINYNTDPVVPGSGSAIFLHVRMDKAKSTSGCIAIPEKDMLALLRWISAAEQPLIVIRPGRAE